MRFARWVFLLAGVSGVIILAPAYLLEQKYGEDHPPALNHPEFYYGFFGLAIAWQILFLVIAADPLRYRPAMPPAMLEKASFAIAIAILFALGRVNTTMVAGAAMDAVWLVLFVIAYRMTSKQPFKTDRAR